MNKEKILDIVIENVLNLMETFPSDQQFSVDENTVLFGKDSLIDSLSVVTVIVDLETLFASDYGQEISLTDDRAMTRAISPFDTVRSLVDYIEELVNENI
jgi:acyl carrier protein